MEREISSKYKTEQMVQAERTVDRFMKSIEASSAVSMERPKRIKELLVEGAMGKKVPIIVNWICPGGTPLLPDEETGKLYRRYTPVSPEEAFNKDYQILPRIELEKKLCRALQRFPTNSMYLKIVADNNPACLYPACFRIDGEEETMKSISNYAKFCQNQFDLLIPGKNISVETWSDLLGKEKFREYIEVFNNTQLEELMPFLPANIQEVKIDILTDHTKPAKNVLPYFETFASDCIKYVAVEGLFLDYLFGDDVILAWNDSTRTARMVDALRKSKGLPAIPKIFVLHEKRDGKIKDNF